MSWCSILHVNVINSITLICSFWRMMVQIHQRNSVQCKHAHVDHLEEALRQVMFDLPASIGTNLRMH